MGVFAVIGVPQLAIVLLVGRVALDAPAIALLRQKVDTVN